MYGKKMEEKPFHVSACFVKDGPGKMRPGMNQYEIMGWGLLGPSQYRADLLDKPSQSEAQTWPYTTQSRLCISIPF